jgi:hypothetical protein
MQAMLLMILLMRFLCTDNAYIGYFLTVDTMIRCYPILHGLRHCIICYFRTFVLYSFDKRPISIFCRALLHFLDPGKFKNKDEFVENYKNLSSFNESEVRFVHCLIVCCSNEI